MKKTKTLFAFAVAIPVCLVLAAILLLYEADARRIPPLVLASASTAPSGTASLPEEDAPVPVSVFDYKGDPDGAHAVASSTEADTSAESDEPDAPQSFGPEDAPSLPSASDESASPAAPQPGDTKPGTLTLRGKTFDLLTGIDEETLSRGIGWMETSAAPGRPGVCVVMGHRDAEFRVLRSVEKGDAVTVVDDTGAEHVYTVVSGEILESANDLRFSDTDEPALALVTCYPFYYKGNAPHRYLVTAVAP